MTMNRKVCKYSIIRFQPDADNDEFANIGIVLYVPTGQRLIYKILHPTQHKRITDFFKPLNQDFFSHTITIIQTELERIKNLLEQSAPIQVDLYHELIRPREDIIRYSNNRAIVSTDTQQTVDELFERYVHRTDSDF